jgi:MFS family permease
MASTWGFASVGSGIGGIIFSRVTGWLVDHYSFRPAFVLFEVIPLVAAWMVWTLSRKGASGPATRCTEVARSTEPGSVAF